MASRCDGCGVVTPGELLRRMGCGNGNYDYRCPWCRRDAEDLAEFAERLMTDKDTLESWEQS